MTYNSTNSVFLHKDNHKLKASLPIMPHPGVPKQNRALKSLIRHMDKFWLLILHILVLLDTSSSDSMYDKFIKVLNKRLCTSKQ